MAKYSLLNKIKENGGGSTLPSLWPVINLSGKLVQLLC